jgi:hypothetical protein
VEIPDGFEKLDAAVYRKDDELIVAGELEPGVPFAFAVKLGNAPDAGTAAEGDVTTWGAPPPGFEWTGEVRPPKKDEYFWSDIRGEVVRAIMDESGVNQFGEPTGGRRILKPVDPAPKKPSLRLVK